MGHPYLIAYSAAPPPGKMTSAARPTWSAALASGGGLRDGSSSAPTLQTCAKDQPGHLKLKLRQIGQDAPEELRSRDFRSEQVHIGTTQRITESFISGDSDAEIDEDSSDDEKEKESTNTVESSESEMESEFEDDDEEELLKELEKIRKERELEKILKEKKAAERDPKAVLSGNPLLMDPLTDNDISFGAKRRWDDDVVFKNQAKGIEEKPQKRFINDTTRSDFHRRFMDKFIK